MEITDIVEYNKASNWLRLVNLIIDLIVFYFFLWFFSIIFGLIIFIIGRLLDNYIHFGRLFLIILWILLYFLFMFAIEYFTKGRSIGKLITGTKVMTEYGERPTVNQFFTRNISRLMPFEFFSFLGSNTGWHDRWSGTCVVKLKDFEDDLQNQMDIEEIGKN